jgi:hypothetical protein
MATRDQVYLSFGQLAELCQLFETELGTALLAHDALTMKAYLQPNPDALQRLEEALARKRDLRSCLGGAEQTRSRILSGARVGH